MSGKRNKRLHLEKITSKAKKYFSSPKLADRIWCSPSLLIRWYLQRVQWLRKSGAVPLIPRHAFVSGKRKLLLF